jgi:hypothetical protein
MTISRRRLFEGNLNEQNLAVQSSCSMPFASRVFFHQMVARLEGPGVSGARPDLHLTGQEDKDLPIERRPHQHSVPK